MFEKLAEDTIARYLEKLAFLANKNNFTHNTSATFSKTTKRPDREPDSISPKKNSGSEYWYMPFGVIRGSDHWGEVGTCNWRLAGSKNHPGKKVYGFSSWENFDKMKKPVTKTAAHSIKDTVDINWLRNLTPGKFKQLVDELKSGQLLKVTGDKSSFSGQETMANAAVGSSKDGFSSMLDVNSPFNAFIKEPKKDGNEIIQKLWKHKANLIGNDKYNGIFAKTYVGTDTNPVALIQKKLVEPGDNVNIDPYIKNFNARAAKVNMNDPELNEYNRLISNRASETFGNQADYPIIEDANGDRYFTSDYFASANPTFPKFRSHNMAIDTDMDQMFTYDPIITKATPEYLGLLDRYFGLKKPVTKTAALDQLLHYTKSDPHNQISKSITQFHHQHPRKAEKILQAIWESRNASGDVKAKIKKYFKKRHALEDWMYSKLPEMGIKADTKYPTYAFSDLGYTPDVLKDEANNSYFKILLNDLADKVTFTPGDSIMNKMIELPEDQRMFYTLEQINKMPLEDLRSKIEASAGTHGHNFLEAQIWATPEELQQIAQFVEKTEAKKVLKDYYTKSP